MHNLKRDRIERTSDRRSANEFASEFNTGCLFTPGPLALHDAVKRQMMFDLGSRSGRFKLLTSEVLALLLDLANGHGSHEAVLFQGGGTFAVEAALSSFISRSDRPLALVNGIYGERICNILTRHGFVYDRMDWSPLVPVDCDLVEARLVAEAKRGQPYSHICFVHSETTMGVLNPIQEIAELSRAKGLVCIADGMSSFGVIDVDLKSTPVDVLVSSGNKGIEVPPGIAFLLVRNSILSNPRPVGSYCLDCFDQWHNFRDTGEWRSTPPTHVLQALHAALLLTRQEGVVGRRRRYASVATRILQGLEPLGFVPVVQPEWRSPVCLAFYVPAWKDDEQRMFNLLMQHLEDNNVHIYTKMHEPTKTFRIGCIGQIEDFWIERLISTVRQFQSQEIKVQ